MAFKHKPEEYVYVYIWEKMQGARNYYIECQQYLAASTNAPLDAVCVDPYADGNHKWLTVQDVVNANTRGLIIKLCRKHRIANPYKEGEGGRHD